MYAWRTFILCCESSNTSQISEAESHLERFFFFDCQCLKFAGLFGDVMFFFSVFRSLSIETRILNKVSMKLTRTAAGLMRWHLTIRELSVNII